MAAIAFDTLKAARRLKEVGVPEAQAEAQAELMAEAFVFNMDALVTRDYLDECLDARFARQETRLNARFSAMDAKIDQRIATLDAKIDQRIGEVNSKMDQRFAAVDLSFAEINGQLRLHNWILAAVAASTVIPALHQLFNG